MSQRLCKCHGAPMMWGRDRTRGTGGKWYCGIRARERARAYYRANRDEVLTKMRARRITRREPRARSYGISVAEYDALLVEQEGKCAICRGGLSTRGRYHFDIDHDHKTGKVRGLLCNRCNRLLSNALEDIGLLHAAAAYLFIHAEIARPFGVDLLGRAPVHLVEEVPGRGDQDSGMLARTVPAVDPRDGGGRSTHGPEGTAASSDDTPAADHGDDGDSSPPSADDSHPLRGPAVVPAGDSQGSLDV